MPSRPAPSSEATILHSARCLFTSSQVWWIVSSGAPDSSNCPPGSSVTLQVSLLSAITLPFSATGFQPNRVRPSEHRSMLASAPS